MSSSQSPVPPSFPSPGADAAAVPRLGGLMVPWRWISLSAPDLFRWPLLLPLLGFLALFFIYPVLRLLPMSVDYTALDLSHYRRLLEEPLYRQVMLRTFRVCAEVTTVALVLGYLLALELSRIRGRLKTFLFGIVLLPFWTSVLVRTYAWIVLLQYRGVLNQTLMGLGLIRRPLPMMYNELGVIIGMVHVVLPFIVFPVYASLQAIPLSLYHAAESLGASPSRTFWRVTVPLSLPGVCAGSMIAFVFTLGFFITPAVLGGSKVMMVAMLIDEQVTQFLNWPLAASLSVCLVVLTIGCLLLYSKWFSDRWLVAR